MAIKHIVIDWNGTLCDMADDTFLMRRIAKGILTGHLKAIASGRITRVRAVARFVRGRMAMAGATRQFYAGEISLAGLYAPYNRDMLAGAPVYQIEGLADGYGPEHAFRVDQRLLAPVLAAREAGATLTIFSAAYDGGIRAILQAADVDIDDIISNTLESSNGSALGLTGKYRDDKSGDFSREFIERRGWSPEEILYSGDTDVDEPIAEILPRGHFLVPFLADENFEARMRDLHGALTPEGPGDLTTLLGG